MKQEFRVILAMALSVGIFITYQNFFAPPPPHILNATSSTTTVTTAVPTTIASALPTTATLTPMVPEAADPNFVATPQTLSIDTTKVKFNVNTIGASITNAELNHYLANAEKGSRKKDALETEDSFALFLGLSGYDHLSPDKIFQIIKDETLANNERHVDLAWQDKNLRVEKSLVINPALSPYAILVKYNVINRSTTPYVLTPYIENRLRQKNIVEPKGILAKLSNSQQDYYHPQYYKEGKLITKLDWKNFTTLADKGTLSWSAISDRYFLIASAPETTGTANTTLDFGKLVDNKGNFLQARLYATPITLNPGAQMSGSFLNYIGPKLHKELEALPMALDKSVDYGWFAVIATPILWLMRLIHTIIPNWGLVIIALTFIIKLATHPINKKSLQSMKAMQLLQPKLQEIKKKYPDDKLKQNEEVMQLFKTHGVNPLGGCLPMLLQMPVYIVLYKVLWNAIELYHAPFLWYKDLSAPDPYYIAPVLLGIFMYFQQKLTPNASADPAQQKMMAFMPVMFSVFMIFLPVGLTIYIFVNTLMSVVQQYMMRHDLTFKDLLKGKWEAKMV